MLEQYFLPFNFNNLLLFSFLLFCADVTGYTIAKLFKINPLYRITYWIWGISIFVFFIFISHFFIRFSHELSYLIVIITTSIAWLISKYSYKNILELKEYLPVILLLIFFLLPFLKPLFFQLSIPPHVWDEMAYHYISPAQMKYEKVWNFYSTVKLNEFSFYAMLPKGIDLAYQFIFFFTKTYVYAQLYQLSLLMTFLIVCSQFLKKNGSLLSSAIFLFGFFYTAYSILFSSTYGYIDSGSAALAVLYFILAVQYAIRPSTTLFYVLVIFFSLAAGSKYTILSFLVGITIPTLIIAGWKHKKTISTFLKEKLFLTQKTGKFIGFSGILFTVFGGFWYIKNLLIAKNPIWPFSILCANCSEGTQKLQNWGYLEFNIENIQDILLKIFNQSFWLMSLFFVAIVIAAFLAVLFKNKAVKTILLILIPGVLIELLIVQRVANFTTRFFYHWIALVPFVLSLPGMFVIKLIKNKKWELLIITSFYILLIVLTIFNFQKINRPATNALKAVSDNNRWFARSKLSLNDWLSPKIPLMKPMILYCNKQQSIEILHTADPELIWGSPSLSKIFLIGCVYKNIPMESNDIRVVAENYNINNQKLPIISTQWCDPEKENPYTEEIMRQYYDLNQLLVCEREEKDSFLYYLPEAN